MPTDLTKLADFTDASLVSIIARAIESYKKFPFLHINHPPEFQYDMDSEEGAGECFAKGILGILTQPNIKSAKSAEMEIEKIRTQFSPFLQSGKFREGAKEYGHKWLGEMSSTADWIMNLCLSPINTNCQVRALMLKGTRHPLNFGGMPFIENVQQFLTSFNVNLCKFEGLFDWLDFDAVSNIEQLLPETYCLPTWYIDGFEPGINFEVEYPAELYSLVCSRYSPIEGFYEFPIKDGIFDSIRFTEFEGHSSDGGYARCLVANIRYKGISGSDIFVTIKTPHIISCCLLIGGYEEWIEQNVAGRVFHSYLSAQEIATGESASIRELQQLTEELDEEIEEPFTSTDE